MIYLALIIVAIAGAILYKAAIVAFCAALWLSILHTGWVLWPFRHPWLFAAYAAGYIVVGAGWSIAKWWFEETDKVRKVKESFSPGWHGYKTWEDYVKQNKTTVSHHKSDIITWITLWPFSAIFTLLDDPLRRLGRRIYSELQGVYQKITDKVWQ